ncbi:hypothetical protein BT93_L5483 [Corymbia citriodora subsp. variegata]|uniref:Defensin n=1 Tax=Corymbia citriodora subsp. variegata TaxID=360336 RepID=A0A8T0CWS1_CORYI|nr:hypothetical protein BT93_L5483 [Corymbia citriodora subsp. variegata]
MKNFQVAPILVLVLFLATSEAIVEELPVVKECSEIYAFPNCKDLACTKFCTDRARPFKGLAGFCKRDLSECLCVHPCQ